jgi:hypothetical protein
VASVTALFIRHPSNETNPNRRVTATPTTQPARSVLEFLMTPPVCKCDPEPPRWNVRPISKYGKSPEM